MEPKIHIQPSVWELSFGDSKSAGCVYSIEYFIRLVATGLYLNYRYCAGLINKLHLKAKSKEPNL